MAMCNLSPRGMPMPLASGGSDIAHMQEGLVAPRFFANSSRNPAAIGEKSGGALNPAHDVVASDRAGTAAAGRYRSEQVVAGEAGGHERHAAADVVANGIRRHRVVQRED